MKKTFYLSVLCFVYALPNFLIAQTAKEKYENGAIYFHKTFWNVGYMKDDKFYKLKDLKNEFIIDSPAKAEFDLYKKTRKKSIIWSVTGLVLYCSSLAILPFADPYSLNEPDASLMATSINLMLGSLVTIIPVAKNSIKSYNHLQKAIWLHNEEVSFK